MVTTLVRMSSVKHVAYTRETANAYISVGKPEGKRTVGRTRHKLEYNIKVDHNSLHLLMRLLREISTGTGYKHVQGY